VTHAAPKSSFLRGQFWFIAKNVIGWLLMLSALPIGVALPGPGGIPIFLVGFALATIPGKRRMTSHVMRGRPVRVNAKYFVGVVTFLSVASSVAIIVYFRRNFHEIVEYVNLTRDERGRYFAAVAGLCVAAMAISWIAARLSVWGMNVMFRTLPKARRMARPWLRKYGIELLPRRRKLLDSAGGHVNENEILHFTEDSHRRFKSAGAWLMLWGRRALALGLTLYIFFWIVKPIASEWPATRHRLGQITPFDLTVSVVMFAMFLGLVRAATWRSILLGFGFPVPRLAALRVWITSELSRYLPGAIWQVVSRVRLIKPYGIRGSVTSTSQVLELAIFLLANVCVAVACLCFLGFKHIHGAARNWFIVALALVPLLSLLLHPRVFYGLTDRILAKLGKPPIANRLTMSHLMRLFAAAVFGLLWQSAALWILLHGPLGIGWRDWWILAGAYCLAWTAGFLAVWAPAGAGVREAVLIGALAVALPPAVRANFNNNATPEALAILTRLWTMVAEVLVAMVAFPLDWRRGAGQSNAVIQRSAATKDIDEAAGASQ
jgi:glycosyltransferase 2 family protein